MKAGISPAVAFAVAAAGIALFSIMDAFMKSLTLALGVYNALFWRTTTQAVIGCGLWAATGAARPNRRTLKLHLLRGTITAAMALLFFWGLARVPMAQAISLSYIAPLIALILGAVLLGERVGARVVIASVAALAGLAIVLLGQTASADGSQTSAGAMAILASAVLYAGNLIVARLQSQAAGPGEIAFFQSSIVAGILALAAPWLLVVPEETAWAAIGIGAALAIGSLWLLAWAYAHGEAGYLAMTEYTSFIYAAVLGWIVFGEHVSPATMVGAVIIVGACVAAARRRDVRAATLDSAA